MLIILINTHVLGENTDTFISSVVDKNRYIEKQNVDEAFHILKRKGEFATALLFHDPSDTQWASKFDIVQAGGLYDKNITPQLLKENSLSQSRYCIGYDWMPAFYYYINSNNRPFINWLYEKKEKTTLNPSGPFTHCKRNHYEWCEDYYYDYFNSEVFTRRVKDLITNMHQKGYNGVFFDWASANFLMENENNNLKEFIQKKYPAKNYALMIGKFYKALQDAGVFVITNQAFRSHENLLLHVDYDMTESYITTIKHIDKEVTLTGKKNEDVKSVALTRYYPIYANSSTIGDTLYYLDLLLSYKNRYKKNGFKNFIYMNYMAPEYKRINERTYEVKKPKNAIYYGYATGKLTDSVIYGEVPYDRSLERDDVYFYDLGKAIGTSYQRVNDMNAYIRFFTNGFVLSSDAYKENKYLQIDSKLFKGKTFIYDAFNQKYLPIKNSRVVIKLKYMQEIFTKNSLPLGRVYLFNNGDNRKFKRDK